MNAEKNGLRRIIASLLCFVMLFTSMDFSAFAGDISVEDETVESIGSDIEGDEEYDESNPVIELEQVISDDEESLVSTRINDDEVGRDTENISDVRIDSEEDYDEEEAEEVTGAEEANQEGEVYECLDDEDNPNSKAEYIVDSCVSIDEADEISTPDIYGDIHYPEGTCGKDAIWYIANEGSATGGPYYVLHISGSGKMNDYTVDRYGKITSPWVSYDYVDKVVVEGISYIGQYAFCDCSCIESVEIQSGVETIGAYAFEGCSNLEKIILRSDIVIEEAINYVDWYNDLNYLARASSTSFYGCFSGCEKIKTAGPIGGGYDYEFSWTEKICDGAFSGLSNLQNVELPESITRIGRWSFAGCTHLETIDLPEEITEIGLFAFFGCAGLTSIVLPDKLITLDVGTFSNCTELNSIMLPGKLTSIGGVCFYNCCNLKEISFNKTLVSIGEFAFEKCISLNRIILPDTVKTIGDRAFGSCTALEYFKYPKNLRNNETEVTGHPYDFLDGIVENCPKLKTSGPLGGGYDVEYDQNEIIPRGFFANGFLKEVNISSSIRIVEEDAFGTWLGFLDCNRSVIIEEGTETIERQRALFDNLYLPLSVKKIGIIEVYPSSTDKGFPTSVNVYYPGSEEDFKNVEIEKFSDGSDWTETVSLHFSKSTVSFNANGGTLDETKRVVTVGGLYGDLPIPVKDGYEFSGWYTSAKAGNLVSADMTVTNDRTHTLYAHWTPKAYTVSFDPNGGECSDVSKTVTFDAKYGKLPTPTRFLHSFGGWYTEKDEGDLVTADTLYEIAGNSTLYAHWVDESSRVVFFEPNGGECDVASKTISYGDQYGDLPEATRSNYDFIGWYTAADGGYRITKTDILKSTGNVTLYAHWKGKPVKVNFVSMNGSITEERTVYFGSTYGTLPTLKRNGYIFKGWYTDSEEGSKVWGSTIVNRLDEHSVYARWDPNAYYIFFDANSGICSAENKTVHYETAIGSLPIASRVGYSFKGWYTAKTNGTKIEEDEIYTYLKNITVYALWEADAYTLSFESNGGSAVASKTIHTGDVYGTLATPTCKGFTFDGWYTSAEGGTKVTAATTVIAANHTLYARWTGKENTVFFKPEAGNCSVSSKDVISGEAYGNLPTATREGYDFLGWYTAKTGGDKISASDTVILEADISLYAHWSAKEYSLTFNAAGGNCSTVTKKVTYDQQYGTLPSATRTGYDFDGWYDAENNGSEVTASTVVKTAKDHTIYAAWNGKSINVYFDANDGQCTTSSIKAVYGQTYGDLPIPTRANYSFEGWFTSKTGGAEVCSTDTVDKLSDTTLYAHWKLIEVEVEAVQISTYSLTLEIGGEATLTATVYPLNATNKAVEWLSNDRSIVTVNGEGLVTAVGEGLGNIIVRTKDGKYSSVCSVTVKPIAVEKVTLNKKKLEITIGQSSSLTATLTPDNATDKTVLWSSDDTDIANVDSDGRITAIGVGTAYISAATRDGSKKDTCEVTVVGIPVDEVSLDKTSAELMTGQTLKLRAIISPEDATDQSISWSSDNEKIAIVNNKGQITAKADGETVIRATAASGVYAECSVKVTPVVIEVEYIFLSAKTMTVPVGGINEIGIQLYPEDATETDIIWSSSDEKVAVVEIEDDKVIIKGKKKGTATIKASAGEGVEASCIVNVEPLEVPVILDANGGSCKTASITCIYGDKYGTLPVPELEGQTFSGWYTSAVGGEKVTEDSVFESMDAITLYAHWSVEEYTVTFDDTLGGISKVMVIYGEPYGSLPVPAEQETKEFKGWYTDKIGGDRIYEDTIVSAAADHILYAHWGGKECFVRFDDTFGRVRMLAVVVGEKYGDLPSMVEQDGYEFIGWYTEKEGGEKVTAETVVSNAEEHTLYAHWREITVAEGYTLIFMANGEEYERLSVSEGDIAGAVAAPSGTGTFIGWYFEGTLWDSTSPVHSDMVLEARFYDPSSVSENEVEKESALDTQPVIEEETEELILIKGQKFSLPDGDWECTEKAFLSVNKNGAVSAKKVTSYPVSLIKKKNGAVVSRIKVTIIHPVIEKKLTVQMGTEKKISLVGYKELNVSWVSAAPDIATVASDGTVYGISKGNAVVTAYINGVAFTCKVKVIEADTSKRNFRQKAPIAMTPMQSINIKADGFKASGATWTSDLDAVPAAKLAKGVVYENSVVRITKAGKITAVGTGTTTLTAKGSNGALTFTVTVPEPVTQVVHLNVQGKKTIKLYGTKGTLQWKSSDTSVVRIDKNKITGLKAGTTTLTTTYENLEYKVVVYVEDPSIITNGISGTYPNYTLNLKAGQTVVLTEKQTYQNVLYKSNKNNIAFVDEAGVLTARSKGKAIITAKVNGKKIKITVNVN